MSADDGVDSALDAVYGATEGIQRLRADMLVQNLVKTVRSSKRYKIDVDKLSDEIRTTDAETDFGEFSLEGPDGLKAANTARTKLLKGRGNLIAMNKALRSILLVAQRSFRIGSGFLREQPAFTGLTVKASADLASLVLREIFEVIEDAERLMEEIKEVLRSLDVKSAVIDGWFLLHKQHLFLTLNQGPHDDQENAQGKRLGRSRSG